MGLRQKIVAVIGFLSIIISFSVVSMEQEKVPTYLKGWKNLRECNDSTIDMSFLACKDKELRVNLDEEDPILLQSFSELWYVEDTYDVPFLLIILHDKAGVKPSVFAPAIGETYEREKSSILSSLAATWQNPITRNSIEQAEIYFGGPDGKLYLLTANASNDFFQNELCHESFFDQGRYNVRSQFFVGQDPYGYVAQLFANEYVARQNRINGTCHLEEEYGGILHNLAEFKNVVDIWDGWRSKEKREASREEAKLCVTSDQPALSCELEACLQSLTHSLQQLARALN